MLVLSYISPAIQDGLSIGSSGVGLLLSAMFFGMIPGALLWGGFVDKIGRKSACVISLIAYSVRLAASALAPNYWTLWGLRYVSGFASPAFWSPSFSTSTN